MTYLPTRQSLREAFRAAPVTDEEAERYAEASRRVAASRAAWEAAHPQCVACQGRRNATSRGCFCLALEAQDAETDRLRDEERARWDSGVDPGPWVWSEDDGRVETERREQWFHDREARR